MRDKPANHKRSKNPVCIVSDYSRTLAPGYQQRSWLMQEYGDDTALSIRMKSCRLRSGATTQSAGVSSADTIPVSHSTIISSFVAFTSYVRE